MLKDDITNFINNLCQYLVNQDNIVGLLVKKHTVNFNIQGDFSFVNTVKSWQEYLTCDQRTSSEDVDFLTCIKKETNDLVQASRSWEIVITRCVEIKDRIHIFVDRPKTISVGLLNAKANNLLLSTLLADRDKESFIKVASTCDDSNITSIRARYFTKVIRNLCLINSFDTDLLVTTKSSDNLGNIFLVGAVLNAKSGVKENTITAEEFIRIRQDELTLIAQHKYGVRVALDEKWKEFIAHLGESAVAFELLQTKASSPVKILFDASAGSSKGAAFILYNCARLETLVRTFNEKVSEGSYPPLPDVEQIDFTLLSNEDEWCLIFNYIMGLPTLLRNSADISASGEKCEFKPHLICNYLSGMVKIFSQYYRRSRILTEPRKHLIPVIHARIYMLKTLNDTLKLCLTILNIKSVSQMYYVFS